MGKRKLAALEKIDADFASLQYKIRRDPKSYQDEFQRQYEQYVSQRDLFLTAPANASTDQVRAFHDLIDLLAHVADCYPEAMRSFPDDLADILTSHHAVLHPELRDKIVGSLGLLRRKDLIDTATLAQVLFPILLHTPSKTLRALLFRRLVSDLRNANSRSTNESLNRTMQKVLYNAVTSDLTSPRPIWVVKLVRELWTRRVWTNDSFVDVMCMAASKSENEKVVVGAVRFFLGGDKTKNGDGNNDDDDDDDESDWDEDRENRYGNALGGGGRGGPVDLQKLKARNLHKKKTKKDAKRYERAVDKVKRMDRKRHAPQPVNFSALHLPKNPQGFAEDLFRRHLQSAKCKFTADSKLLILQLVTRLHGMHQLWVPELFSWFTKYLTPRQQNVTSYLASLAQAVHVDVPEDYLEPLVTKIANEFASEASAAEVAAAGLSAIREVLLRQPRAISDTLLQDLVLMRKSKDKGVMMAARGLLSLYRVVGAELLAKKDRGKDATIALRAGERSLPKFGERIAGGIEGIELLEKWKEEEKERKREEAQEKKRKKKAEGKEGDGEEVEDAEDDEEDEEGDSEDDSEANSSEWDMSDDSDDSGWIAVSSEDEAPPLKRTKGKGKGLKGEGEEEEEDSDDEDDENEEDAETSAAKFSKLATTRILTPADLAKLRELRMQANVDKVLGKRENKGKAHAAALALAQRHAEDGLTAKQIELASTLRKSTKEERIARAKEGSDNTHTSTQSARKAKKEAEGKSMTNSEKARRKNIFMTMGKARKKHKRSLIETRKALTQHVARAKRGGRRGNRG